MDLYLTLWNSIVNEKRNAAFVLYQRILVKQICLPFPFKSFSLAVHISRKVNGNIRAMFSKHSVVNVTVPSDRFSQIHQPPITSERGFIHILRFSNVRNRIITVKNTRQNSLRKYNEFLNVRTQAMQAVLIPLPASVG